MSSALRWLILGTIGAALLGGLAWSASVLLRPVPTRSQAIALYEAGRMAEAVSAFQRYLRAVPGDDQARFLLARSALEGSDPDPELALEQLKKTRFEDPGWRAQVRAAEGLAHHMLHRYDAAEDAWKAALELDPVVAEAGWGLLSAYFFQGRRREARELAFQLYEVEPSRADRVQLLLDPIRYDALPVAAGALVQLYEPIVQKNPKDLYSRLALGLALVRDGRDGEGLKLLRATVAEWPDEVDARIAYLRGLEDSGRIDRLAEELERLPEALADDPRLGRFRGRIAEARGEWSKAVQAYRRAWEDDPYELDLAYRLRGALRQVGETAEADELDARLQAAQQARSQARALYEEAEARDDLGRAPAPDLYRRLAHLREQMGLHAEALAWHRLILEDDPDDPESLVAVQRLSAEQ